MSLYPTFEDLKVDSLLTAQKQAVGDAYASMATFLGLDLSNFHYDAYGELVPGPPPAPPTAPAICPESMPSFPAAQPTADTQTLAVPSGSQSRALVSAGAKPGEIKQGLRNITLCKGSNGKVGVQLISVDKGIFVSFVERNSPAALGGLRFGDQVVSICGVLVAGMSSDKAMKIFRQAPINNIEVIVRDRPFERTVVVNKDSMGSIGITIDDGEIKAIHKDSSAARNGLLIHHQIVEVNGQNVMGLKDKELKELLHVNRDAVQLTIIPTVIYKHLVKRLLDNRVRKDMDRSLPSA